METAATTDSNRGRHGSLKRVLPQGTFLLLVWLILSGKFDAVHIGMGVASVLFILWLDRRLGPIAHTDAGVGFDANIPRLALYVPWLVWQMLAASMHVSRLVLSPSMHERLDPNLVAFRSGQPHAVAKVVLGNSISLTPGTVTLDIDGDRFLVHSLTDATTRSLFEGTMQGKVARVFNTNLEKPVNAAEVVHDRYKF